jgi:hypothetical protein
MLTEDRIFNSIEVPGTILKWKYFAVMGLNVNKLFIL